MLQTRNGACNTFILLACNYLFVSGCSTIYLPCRPALWRVTQADNKQEKDINLCTKKSIMSMSTYYARSIPLDS